MKNRAEKKLNQSDAFEGQLPKTEIQAEKESAWHWFRLWKNGEQTVHFCKAPNGKIAYKAFEDAGCMREDASYGTPAVEDDFFKTIPANFLGREKKVSVSPKLSIKVVSYQNMK
jgi:hypothetical protein